MRKGIWTTKEGEKLKVSEMETSHLINAYCMCRRKGFVSPDTLSFYLTTSGPNGDMAQMAFEEELMAVVSAPVSVKMGNVERELERRKIPRSRWMHNEFI